MKRGFTLIELLVVVLIIGILSAVALPQYTKAVEKSHLSEALSMMKSLENAVDVYRLSNPNDTSQHIEESLDIDITHFPKSSDGGYYCSKNFCYSVGYDHVIAGRWTAANPFSAGAPEYDLSSRKQADGSWTHIYSICNWSGGDIFGQLRSLGYTEGTC